MIHLNDREAAKFDKAIKLLEKNPEKAYGLLKDVIKTLPTKEVYLNLGNACRYLDKDDLAAKYWIEANKTSTPFMNGTFINSGYPLALNNLGLLAYAYQNIAEAELLLKEAIIVSEKLGKNADDALFNLAQTKLLEFCDNPVDYSCWNLYTYRFSKTNPVVLKTNRKDFIMWKPEYGPQKIAVLAEQGYGDTFLFSRYLPLIPGEVHLQCSDSLRMFYEDYNPFFYTEEIPDVNYCIPLGTLPKYFNEIPKSILPQLPRKPPGDRLQIGVVWSGNSRHGNDRHRSVNYRYFNRLAKYGDLYSLNPAESDKHNFKQLKPETWQDTYEMLRDIDLVICVDTSIANFCGSIGKPCWVLMPLNEPDWRWGTYASGFNNIWYPSVRVFRNRNNWDAVFDEVERCLQLVDQGSIPIL